MINESGFICTVFIMNILVKKRVWTKVISTIVGLSVFIPVMIAEARIAFNAPAGLGVPGRRVAGAARTPQDKQQCTSARDRLTAIVPKSNIGLTTAANPVLYFYVPETSNSTLELVVQDEKQTKVIAQQDYKSSGKARVIGFPLNKTSLEVGKQYHWFFSIICNSKERSNDHVVDGALQRIQPNPQLIKTLNAATPTERVNIYARFGIWYDALTTLAQLMSANPSNQQFKADWKALLTAEGVNLDREPTELMKEPLPLGNQAPQPI